MIVAFSLDDGEIDLDTIEKHQAAVVLDRLGFVRGKVDRFIQERVSIACDEEFAALLDGDVEGEVPWQIIINDCDFVRGIQRGLVELRPRHVEGLFRHIEELGLIRKTARLEFQDRMGHKLVHSLVEVAYRGFYHLLETVKLYLEAIFVKDGYTFYGNILSMFPLNFLAVAFGGKDGHHARCFFLLASPATLLSVNIEVREHDDFVILERLVLVTQVNVINGLDKAEAPAAGVWLVIGIALDSLTEDVVAAVDHLPGRVGKTVLLFLIYFGWEVNNILGVEQEALASGILLQAVIEDLEDMVRQILPGEYIVPEQVPFEIIDQCSHGVEFCFGFWCKIMQTVPPGHVKRLI